MGDEGTKLYDSCKNLIIEKNFILSRKTSCSNTLITLNGTSSKQ